MYSVHVQVFMYTLGRVNCSAWYVYTYSSIVLDSIVLELLSIIVKWGDDLRQELLCSQLLEQFRVSK